MSTFNIAEAKTHFSQLVQKAMLGEEIIIAKDNTPVLKLVPLDKPKRPRQPGSGKGQKVVEVQSREVMLKRRRVWLETGEGLAGTVLERACEGIAVDAPARGARARVEAVDELRAQRHWRAATPRRPVSAAPWRRHSSC